MRLSSRQPGRSRHYLWRVAGSGILQVSLPNTYWDHLDLKTLSQSWQRLSQTLDEPPDAGPHVRWCERGRGNPASYSIQRKEASHGQ
jgi:hypothetical protein